MCSPHGEALRTLQQPLTVPVSVPMATGATARCTLWTVCDPDSEYQTRVPNAISDRTCATVSSCNWAVEYECRCTVRFGSHCSPLTVCNSTQYESVARTATSDCACTPLTVAIILKPSMSRCLRLPVAPSSAIGNVLHSLSVIPATVVVNATETSDRSCFCTVPTLKNFNSFVLTKWRCVWHLTNAVHRP